jgi:outer membrane protein OmpA-like peptidoglycan-associated protein
MKLYKKKILGLAFYVALVAGCGEADVYIPISSDALVDQSIQYAGIDAAAPNPARLDQSPPPAVVVAPNARENAQVEFDDGSYEAAAEVRSAPTQRVESAPSPTAEASAVETAAAGANPAPAATSAATATIAADAAADTASASTADTAAAVDELDPFYIALAEAEARAGLDRSAASSSSASSPSTAPAVAIADKGKGQDKAKKAFDKKLVVSDNAVEAKSGVSFLSTIVYHGNARADLSARDLSALKAVVAYARKKNADVVVVGHASSRTKNMAELDNKLQNFDLSARRARIVADRLVSLGLPRARVSVSAASDTNHVLKENMPLHEAVNRRTEIYIVY